MHFEIACLGFDLDKLARVFQTRHAKRISIRRSASPARFFARSGPAIPGSTRHGARHVSYESRRCCAKLLESYYFNFFYGLFYGWRKFCCKSVQFCETRRKPHSLGLPMIRNAVQHSENVRNSLGLNYKSVALNQLSYAGAAHTKAVLAS